MTTHSRNRSGGRRGLQIALAGCIALVLAVVAFPGGRRGNPDDLKANTLQSTIERVESALQRHLEDTGRGAVEFSGSSFLEPRFHQLSRQSFNRAAAWKGPYLSQPLTTADNPFGGFVYLYDHLKGGTADPGPGFWLTGPDGPCQSGNGQFLAFGRVSRRTARELDARLDKNVPGDWETHGRVKYNAKPAGILMVHICQLPSVAPLR